MAQFNVPILKIVSGSEPNAIKEFANLGAADTLVHVPTRNLWPAHGLVIADGTGQLAALALGASTVLGRAASGGVVALGSTALRTILAPVTSSSGAPDAGKLIALDGAGLIDLSLIPPGVGNGVVDGTNKGTVGARVFDARVGDDLTFRRIQSVTQTALLATEATNQVQLAVQFSDGVAGDPARLWSSAKVASELANLAALIAGKIGSLVEDTTPQLGGDLDIGSLRIVSGANELLRWHAAGSTLYVGGFPVLAPDIQNPQAGEVLGYTGTEWTNVPAGGGGSGEANSGANLGAGIGVYDGKAGQVLEFRSLVPASARLTAALDAGNGEIDLDVDPSAISVGELSDVNLTGLVDGAMLYASGGLLVVRTPGTAGQVLRMTGGVPTWETLVAFATGSAGLVPGPTAGDVTANRLLQADGSWVDPPSGGGGGAVDSVFGRTGAVVAAAGDYDAAQVDVTPAGGIAATDVQGALQELDTEKAPLVHLHDAAAITAGELADARISESSVTQHEGAIDHDALSGFLASEHRRQDDTATTSTNLWSASKVQAEIDALVAAIAAKIGSVQDDTAPVLGGDLDISSFSLVAGAQELLRWHVGSQTLYIGGVPTLSPDITNPQDGEVLTYDSVAGWRNEPVPGGGGGEANTGANLGAGVGVFDGKNGVALEFRSIVAKSSKILVQLDGVAGEIELDVDPSAISVGDLSDVNLASVGDNALLYYDSAISAFRVLGPGTVGQVLTLAAGSPQWQDPAGGGAVDSVFGRTGAVVAVAGDYNAGQVTLTPTGGIAATNVQAAVAELDSEKAATGHSHANATGGTAGFMSAADKTKLDAVEAGAKDDQVASEVPVTPTGGIASTNVQAALAELDSEKATTSHGHSDATTGASGFMSAADKTKLDAVEAGATADQVAGDVPFTPTGGIAATDVQAALAELDTEKATSSHGHANATTGAAGFMSSGDKSKLDGIESSAKDDQAASEVPFTPTGNIAATDVQAALAEIDSEKAPTSHVHAADDITSGTLADARVAQSNVTQHQGAINHNALTNYVAREHLLPRYAEAYGPSVSIAMDAGVWVNMPMTTVRFNVGGFTVDTTNRYIQVPLNGTYLVSARYYATKAGAGGWKAGIKIQHWNGSTWSDVPGTEFYQFGSGGGDLGGVTTAGRVQMNAGERIRIPGQAEDDAALPINGFWLDIARRDS